MWVFGIALTPPTKNTILAFFKFVKYLFTIYSYLFLPDFICFCVFCSCFVKFILVRVAWRLSLYFVCDSVCFFVCDWPCYLPSLTSFSLFLVLILVKFTNRTGTTMLDEKKSSVSYCFYYIILLLLLLYICLFFNHVLMFWGVKTSDWQGQRCCSLHYMVSWFLTSWPPRPPLFSKSEHQNNVYNQALTRPPLRTFLRTWSEHCRLR